MPGPLSVRELLVEVCMGPGRDASEARIYYAHRGAKEGVVHVGGDEVEEIPPNGFRVGGVTIPFHKVFRVTYGDEVLLDREPLP